MSLGYRLVFCESGITLKWGRIVGDFSVIMIVPFEGTMPFSVIGIHSTQWELTMLKHRFGGVEYTLV